LNQQRMKEQNDKFEDMFTNLMGNLKKTEAFYLRRRRDVSGKFLMKLVHQEQEKRQGVIGGHAIGGTWVGHGGNVGAIAGPTVSQIA